MFLALTLVVGVFVFPSSASATHDLLDYESAVDAMLAVDPTLDPPPGDGKRDFVVGGFQFANSNFAVSAHSGPTGEEPFGHVNRIFPHFTQGPYQGRWRVTCVAVAGKSAALTLEPRTAGSNDDRNRYILSVFDGGPGGTLDRFTIYTTVGQSCVEHVAAATAFGVLIERGNILVHDALPQP